jgi:multidrug efflux pump subunit AcrB
VVTIENIERRIEEGEPVTTAVLTGSNEVLFPELVSTLVICIVFVPIMLLSGVSAYIFQPLALAVVFALIASFLLSRTLVPVLVSLLLPADLAAGEQRLPALLRPLQHAVERGLHGLGAVHARMLQPLLSHPIRVALSALAALVLAIGGLTEMPRTFFPTADTGLIRMHLRAPAGTRLEETATRFAAVEQAVREALPPGDIAFVVANVGLPDPINIGWVPTAAIGSFDGELLLQLGPGHRPTETVEAVMRQVIATQFPDLTVFFRAADATSQTLAGAAATDIDVRFAGRDVPGNAELAKRFMAAAKNIPGVADLSLRQVNNLPEYFIRVERVRASQLGLTPADAMGEIGRASCRERVLAMV